MTTTGGTEQLLTMIRVMLGDPQARDEAADIAMGILEDKVLGPSREHRATLAPEQRRLHFAPETRTYVLGVLDRGAMTAEGLIWSLIEAVLTRDESRPARPAHPVTEDHTELDWDALEADRDDLFVRLGKERKLLRKAERDRDVEARNADTLTTRLGRANERNADQVAQIRDLRSRVEVQENTIVRMDEEISNHVETINSLRESLGRMDGDLIEAKGRLADKTREGAK